MTLDDMVTNIKDMSTDQLMEYLSDIRKRRIKPAEVAAREVKKKEVKAETALLKQLEGVDPKTLKLLLGKYLK